MVFAHTLGETPHVSPLLRKARRLGYSSPDDLLRLAVVRGCLHYASPDIQKKDFPDCGRELFSNTELAVALVSGSQEGDARHIRVAAQLLGSLDVSAAEVARFSQMERCVPIVRYIAEAGARDDSEGKGFWTLLLELLPEAQSIPEGRMPHPSRFMSQPGWSPRSRPTRRATWLRADG